VIIGTATFMVHEDLLHLGVPAATIPQGAPVVVHVGPQIILEGHLASTFVLYLDCLYSASHDFRIMDENLKKNCTKSIYMIRICECYIRLWLLGDHFKDNTFKNKVMNKLIGETSTGRMFIFRSQITMVFDTTDATCVLRAWVTDSFVAGKSAADLERYKSFMPHGWLRRLCYATDRGEDQERGTSRHTKAGRCGSVSLPRARGGRVHLRRGRADRSAVVPRLSRDRTGP